MQKSIKINYLEHSTTKFYSIPAAATDCKQYVYQQLVIVNKKIERYDFWRNIKIQLPSTYLQILFIFGILKDSDKSKI